MADGFQPGPLAFFDADHGIIAGPIVCPTCAEHRTAAISTTADGGRSWGAPTTFHCAAASAVTVVPGGTDAWALVGTRLQHSGDGGATWSFLPQRRRHGPELRHRDGRMGDPADHRVFRRRRDEGRRPTWIAGPTPCHPGASTLLFVTRSTVDDGWAVCGGDAAAGSLRQVVWKTTDGGTTWTREFHGVAPGPVGYRFLDDGHGWRWHYNFADIFRSTDGGNTWEDLGSVGNVLVDDVWFVSDARGFAISERPNGASHLLVSADGGDDWRARPVSRQADAYPTAPGVAITRRSPAPVARHPRR